MFFFGHEVMHLASGIPLETLWISTINHDMITTSQPNQELQLEFFLNLKTSSKLTTLLLYDLPL